MKNKKPFLALPREIMNTKNTLHKELFKFETNTELKVFIAVLAYATTIIKSNKIKGVQAFSTIGFLGDNRFLPFSLTVEKLENIITNMRTPFFDTLIIEDKKVSFKLSDIYIKSVFTKGFQKINLMDLKSCKSLKATKLSILTTIYPDGYLNLNYLLEVLDVNKNLSRTGRIREIKRAFGKINHLENWEYKYPKSKQSATSDDYKFYYKNKVQEITERAINIKETSDLVEEYSDEYFDEEPEKAQKEPEVEEDFDLDTLLADLEEPNPVRVENNDIYDIPF